MNRTDFPILNQLVHGRQLVYLDNAATTQKPTCVLDAITYAYTHFNANVHRGVHHLSQVATQEHENAREKIASFIHAASSKEIIFTKGTTNSLNMLAFSFGEAYIHEGDEIIVSSMEHHSNIVPWQMLAQRKKAILRPIPLKQDCSLDMQAFRSMLTNKTKIISITHVSNVLGIENPIKEIVQIAKQKNIPVCIDAAQSIAHMPIDVQELDCDFMVFSAHKIYGPTGLGVLYGKEKWLTNLPPAEGGGEMIEHVSFINTTYNTLPYKFEAGTPNYIGSYAFTKALQYIEENRAICKKQEEELMTYMEEQLVKIPNIKVYAQGQQKYGTLSFNAYQPNGTLIHPFDIGVLLDQQGIAVRTGHHCAEPLMGILEVPGTIRASIAIYNNKQDIDSFIQALNKAIQMLS